MPHALGRTPTPQVRFSEQAKVEMSRALPTLQAPTASDHELESL